MRNLLLITYFTCEILQRRLGFLRQKSIQTEEYERHTILLERQLADFLRHLVTSEPAVTYRTSKSDSEEVFVADPGMKFAYIDLEQAESRLVGAIEWNLFHDGTYLDACESGDLHTTVCRLAWGDQLKWTDDIKANRAFAEQPFYRQHSYRHMAKVLGHGTNYNGQPYTMAQHTKLDQKLIANFQLRYFAAFTAHKRWHAAVAETLRRDGFLVSLSGRRRWFFGRRDDDATIREAIAYDPQGSVGDILNRGMLQVWRTKKVQVLLQIHDAILIQYPEDRENEIVPAMLEGNTCAS